MKAALSRRSNKIRVKRGMTTRKIVRAVILLMNRILITDKRRRKKRMKSFLGEEMMSI